MGKKLTTLEIINRCKELGIEFTDEEYIDAHYLHNFKCSCGNIFERNWNNVWSKRQIKCDDCLGIIKWDYRSVEELLHIKGYIILTNKYINSHTKFHYKDNFGYFYFGSLNNFMNRTPRIFAKSNPYTILNIKLWLKLNNKPFELVSNIYIDAHKDLKWKCLNDICKEEWDAPWNTISNGSGCPYCCFPTRKVGLSNCLATKFPILASEWHPTLNGDLTPYDVSCVTDKDVWWKCEKGHEWHDTVAHRNSIEKRKCPYCFGRYPSEEYNLLVINPELCKDWDYERNDKTPEKYNPYNNEYVWWKCSECNYKWFAQISSRSKENGSGCPECSKSKGEKRINNVLISCNWNNISLEEFKQLIDKNKYNKNYFIPQMKYKELIGIGGGLLSYDHYIPKLNLLIEYQGEHHERPVDFEGKGEEYAKEQFIKQVEHDRRKREYAKKNNIKLLEIWYWDYNNIEDILNNIIKENI